MVTTEQVKHDIAAAFVNALSTKDWELLRGVLSPDVTWTLPGDNQISGTAHGARAVLDRAALIAGYGLKFELRHVLVSRDNMALSLHNTATRGDLVLDEYLATVCRITDGRISEIETYLSDVEGMNAFFAEPA